MPRAGRSAGSRGRTSSTHATAHPRRRPECGRGAGPGRGLAVPLSADGQRDGGGPPPIPFCYLLITVGSSDSAGVIGFSPERASAVVRLLLAIVLVAQIVAWCGVVLAQPGTPTAAVAADQHDHSPHPTCDSPLDATVAATIGESRRLGEAASLEFLPTSAARATSVSGPACAPVLGPPGAQGSPPSGRSLLTSLGIARI